MKILGISCFYHDSAASIIENGEIIASVQEERFTREKHTPDFPVNSIKFCLEKTGYLLEELDGIIFYLILTPFSILSKVFKSKSDFRFQNSSETNFNSTEKVFDKDSFERRAWY